MAKSPSFLVPPEEGALISRIVDRAMGLNIKGVSRMDLELDITAAHANGCELDLQGLLTARPADFSHDVAGICTYIDRRTGRLTEHFCPRHAK